MSRNPILDFGIDRTALGYIGEGLQRPECILAEPDGTLWSADARGGVVRIEPDARQATITQTPPSQEPHRRSARLSVLTVLRVTDDNKGSCRLPSHP